MTASDPYAHDDAAYVLGALDGADRGAFEAHLLSCAECRDRVDETRAVVEALAAVPLDDLYADLSDPTEDMTPPDTLLPSLLREARHRRRRRWGIGTALAAAAAAAVAAVLIGVTSVSSAPSAVAMTPLVASPVHATAAVTATDWGTEVRLTCHYDSAYSSSASYNLVITSRDGRAYQAGSWRLSPGRVTRFTGGAAIPRSQIARVDITYGSTPILELRP